MAYICVLTRGGAVAGGWRMLLGSNNPHWDLRENLQKVQPKYGAAPFYKLGIETRNAPPYDVIITVSEGDLGLPSKEFYTLGEKDPVIAAYHTYLRDILAHMVASSTTKSQEYAKMIFNYERRIALDVMGVLREAAQGNASQPQIRTMQQLADEAPSRLMGPQDGTNETKTVQIGSASAEIIQCNFFYQHPRQTFAPNLILSRYVYMKLPILQTAQAMFRRKITENTQVLVSSPIALKMISQIITTTDKEILNNFVMWSVIRHFVPYMSHNFRQSLLEFEKVLYGVEHKQPIWHFCTKVVQQWMPYGLEALRENPKLVVHDREQQDYGGGGGGEDRRAVGMDSMDPYHSSRQVQEVTAYDEEMVRLMFYHIRDEYKGALNNANWVNQQLTKYIADKLSMMRVQIGIPEELLKSERTVNEFYNDVVLDELLFVDNVVTHWEFVKKRMDRMMDNGTDNERIAAELFPPSTFGSRRTPVANLKYSVGLNMVIIAKEKTREPYFHYKYPLSLNFARLGADISLVIHDAVNTLAEQFGNVEASRQPRHIRENVFDEEAQKCMTKKLQSIYLNTAHISNATKLHSYLELASTSMLAQSFQSLLEKIARNERLPVADIPEKSTYASLGLRHFRRQPGLQRYDEQQLFALAFLQRHCAVVPEGGAPLRFSKILADNDIPSADKFTLMWRNVPELAGTLDCSASSSGSVRRPVTAAAQVGATTTTNPGTGGSGGSRKRSSKKRKKPVPSASYYDPAFTWPQFPGAPPQYTPGGGSVVVPEVVAGVEVGPKTATVTAVTSKSGDIVYPKIDVNSIFF
ncbi:conserved hypothetical protein [Culex quinquefasciatus]|uniref:Peptidase M13 N-terminal domain-containing protein n=1 Tax=Culex quinquefasciatus TaxID=7176 RepID=B0XEQ2_CULQU|nr:conserved hypothetical protein [Culex quinquefasciatus]|eukprot:XP_001868124.1 conserved hypothetical protein [Culex quinquefasciatus]